MFVARGKAEGRRPGIDVGGRERATGNLRSGYDLGWRAMQDSGSGQEESQCECEREDDRILEPLKRGIQEYVRNLQHQH
jgi:hypothetical protein|nr:MAG: hypothetical protein DIU61_19435 [Bacteroidota bacterium]